MISLDTSLLLTTCPSFCITILYSRVKVNCTSQANCDENKTTKSFAESLLREK